MSSDGVCPRSSAAAHYRRLSHWLVANIYLHEVLDKWFDEVVRPRLDAPARIIRYADDFMIIFESKRDAERVHRLLAKRFAKYGLEIHPDKTRLVEFNRPGPRDKRGNNSVDFLGMTHYWGRSRRKKWIVKQKTAKGRLSRALKAVSLYCRKNLHLKAATLTKNEGAAQTIIPDGTRALQLLRGDAQQPIAEQVLSPDETDMAKMAQPAEPREVDAMGAV